MRQHPQPYFRSARRLWYVHFGDKQVNLGSDRDEAFRRYYALLSGKTATLARNVAETTTGESLVGLIEPFLAWTQKHKAPGTYEFYVGILTSFAKTLPRSFAVMQIKPFHIYEWVDAHPKWSTGMKLKAC